ncbi:unnamed protein product [Kuraishia capsulata CBS 1993]|uniref:5-oxoprolinase n=1 Tax=Kuraishia capsulata CBS 1993 TaxID=1382522 RepID=W6MKM5_9ASCO|nr:uncharacterized protein KUCA_T00002525001 [Kuraishia capsulata CBS 1993]CDK26553.1 unnamed protein product [Kuraishia capsulata CBS 1993]
MGKIRIAIDRGGTFTDCVGNPGTGDAKDDVILKLLSVDPSNYPDAPLEGIRRLLEKFSGKPITRGEPLDTSQIEYIRMGTTVATNALLERKGERCALITTKGFKDCLVIGNQSRPRIFDLSISKPDVLYETVVEIDERVTLQDFSEDPAKFETVDFESDADLVKGLSGEAVRILKKPDVASIRSTLELLYATGLRSVGICLMHSYTFPAHEILVGEIAKEVGFTHVSLSSDLSPVIKFVPRANSSIADAYLTPEIKRYLSGFQSGLKEGLASVGAEVPTGVRCQFMQSDGGLVDASRFSGLRAILSGPAGGVVGYSATCYNPENNIPLIGFDMGGTSTDVSRYGDGKFDHVFETTTAGVTIQSPQLDINTVAAGGGSMLFFRNGLFQVGPESASSQPGPSCYRKGGPLTVTDANLVLGRLLPEYFPKIFGKDENQTLDQETPVQKFMELTKEINAAHPDLPPKSIDEIAYGFIKIANETMSRPIRQLTEAKGHVISNHRLVSFGGAGGQHAVAVADSLGVDTVLIHRYSSVLSAYGMALANVVEEVREPCSLTLNATNDTVFQQRFVSLISRATTALESQGFRDSDIVFEKYLNMRFEGTESSIMVSGSGSYADFEAHFLELHKREFGFVFEGKDLIVDDVRVRAIGKALDRAEESIDSQIEALNKSGAVKEVAADAFKFKKEVYFEGGRLETSVFRLEDLEVGTNVPGPAIIADGTQTNVIPPNSSALVLKNHVVITISKGESVAASVESETTDIKIDPVLLSIFGHRFMDIAEQMGTSLQKTSVSVNVKERLDFSCALFDPVGNLVANAPHLPVHLGSMSTCIAAQAKIWKDRIQPGDVIVTNHPSAGGTHLPDITVVTPAFKDGEIIFYVASRAHHADIGGLLPGSMPPNSKHLSDEGAAIYSELLVEKGVFQEAKLRKLLLEDPAKHPNCSGTRKLSDNISDLNAQISANQKGLSLIAQLVKEFGLATIHAYMTAIQDNAATTVTRMLADVAKRFDGESLKAEDYMDDGSRIKLEVKTDAVRGKTVFDFTGTSSQAYNNLNAPTAITYSAIIYCMRCLVDEDIPLNQGCLRPIEVIIPEGSLLSPLEGCAVVGGNVETSQRITDVILKAFHVMADSQGDCNNFTFGTGGNSSDGDAYVEGFGYYETIAGGHGAGPTWHGVSGVHTNMTNTRITDAEIFERRYPVILRDFSIRKGSGGHGEFNGGDGCVRDIEFSVPVTASILSERRVIAPHGFAGGEDGQRGVNLYIKTTRNENGEIVEQRQINIGGRNTVEVNAGDRIIIQTPGGGGYGVSKQNGHCNGTKKVYHADSFLAAGSLALRSAAQLTN